jgi:heptaprenyl diphosphate synthase
MRVGRLVKRVAAPEPNEALFAETVQRVKRYMHHPFLAANRIEQQVSRFHFDVVHWLLSHTTVSPQEWRTVVDAVLLLQQGLSIHEEVDRVSGIERQLTVLAGDYDSSRYYWLLARQELNRVIEALSDAVVHVNEAKMDLFAAVPPVPAERVLSDLETIEGALLFAIARVYHPDNNAVNSFVRAQVRKYVTSRVKRVAPWISPSDVQAWEREAGTGVPLSRGAEPSNQEEQGPISLRSMVTEGVAKGYLP